MNDFIMDTRDINRLADYFKRAPQALAPAVRKSLDHLALRTTENDKRFLHESMIIRDERFLNMSLRVQNARGSNIKNMEAVAGSVRRERFSGWEEQQTGRPARRHRAATDAARGGNRRAKMKGYARLRSSSQIYKPEQFQGRSRRASFSFMMRVLNSRNGGQFLLSDQYGRMKPGLYRIKGHRISRLQTFDNSMQPRRNQWRTRSLQLLRTNNNLKSVWQHELDKWVREFR